MKIKHQLSIATLVMAGVFATGCSQQSVMGEGASQVAGGQQVSGGQQVAGGEQMAGGQQVAGGQQAAGGQQVAGGQQAAGGQQVAGGQQGMDSQIPATVPVAEVPMAQPKPPVVAPKPMPKPVNKWCHSHAANSMTKSVSHCHKYNQRNHSHSYGQKKVAPTRPYVAPKVPTMAPKAPPVDVFALQTKLKAKGYYRGPIDGVVGSGTRAALQQFMQNQR
ncbi:peptidoglycan-binding domain-containing protein [Leucothrix mucor]|uniref:peptidoglycan-binding domain-containing protein n=1 Tax=Leucothrix mucor TaxID=45248 RepID=UPI0003B5DAB2|nr:peptidoglycan-binding domain-containing protein [Leucothrix mucor]